MIRPEQVVVQYSLPHDLVPVGHTYRYYYLPPMGLGETGAKVVDLDFLIDPSLRREAYEQVLAAEAGWITKKNLTPVGLTPFELNGHHCMDAFLANYRTFVAESDLREAIKDRKGLNDIKLAVHEKFGVPKSWECAMHLRNYGDYRKRADPNYWFPQTLQELPAVVRLVESLPFEVVGYTMVLKFGAGLKQTVHRDSYAKDNDVHLINISLDGEAVPFYVWDEREDVKHYVQSTAFTFNELDIHGADASDRPRYFLRVDGRFKPELQERLGFKNGLGFSWQYPHVKDYVNRHGIDIDVRTYL